MKDKMWVVTRCVNDYNQHGEYFVSAFLEKPSVEELTRLGLTNLEAEACVTMGGDRIYPSIGTDEWYYLHQIEVGEAFYYENL